MKTKPFNLSEALAGKPVVTRNGERVTEIREFKSAKGVFPIVGVVDGSINAYTKDGSYFYNSNPSHHDLLMVSAEKTGWVNIYEDGSGYVYSTQEEADSKAAMHRIQGKAIPFTYEE